jgi:hypothetical protein
MERCELCRYFKADKESDGGLCRRNPPQPFLVPMPPAGRPGPVGVHPATDKKGWCGQYEPEVSLN